MLYTLRTSSDKASNPNRDTILTDWPSAFYALLETRAPETYRQYKHESSKESVLGMEGTSLSNLREYLRSCLEVGVRGWGNVDAARGSWKEIVERSLEELGVM